MMTFRISAIGYVVGGRGPADDDHWSGVAARIDLDPLRFRPEALHGLEAFSHAEIIFVFDGVPDHDIVEGARHPRDNQSWPRVGIFAQRGRNRPNRLGVSICNIVGIDGTSLHVTGLDAISGTPVVDIKPVMTGFQPRGTIREPGWAREIMVDYW
jgi:tRNA (adenine37-N6)-methyltransferase